VQCATSTSGATRLGPWPPAAASAPPRWRGPGHGGGWPFTEAEANPEWAGNYDFIDAELHTRHPHRIEPATLRRYREAYAAHFNLWKDAAIRHQAPLARIPCATELIAALYQHALPVKALETTK
jgi:hypothetical protein